jgi:hypothetical protein
MARVTIHAEQKVAWHRRYLLAFTKGLNAQGIQVEVSTDRVVPGNGIPLLFGPNYFVGVQDNCASTNTNYLIVNRCFFGDHNDNIALSWNGINNRGDFGVPPPSAAAEAIPHELRKLVRPWSFGGNKVVLCGQVQAHAPEYGSIDEWLGHALHLIRKHYPTKEVVFRSHPARRNQRVQYNLDEWRSFADVCSAVTLNSTVAVDFALHGVPVVACDYGNPAYDVASKHIGTMATPNRARWLRKLAWSQWHIDEVERGVFWDTLKHPPRNSPQPGFRS